jgi:hypothetical protein
MRANNEKSINGMAMSNNIRDNLSPKFYNLRQQPDAEVRKV